MSMTFPIPAQVLHIPLGLLKEKYEAGSILGMLILEKSSRNAEYISLIVPTVDLELPPSLLWSIITEGLRLSINSTLGFSYLGSRPLIHPLYVSFIWRWLSAAIVSKTMLDLPEPETPVNTTILLLGISSDIFFRLFCRSPLILIAYIFSLSFYTVSEPRNAAGVVVQGDNRSIVITTAIITGNL